MEIPEPSIEDLLALAAEFRFTLSEDEAAQLLTPVRDSVEGYSALDELELSTPALEYPRDGGRAPSAGENPVNGWAWRCSSKGRAEGPLAGRTVASKEHAAV